MPTIEELAAKYSGNDTAVSSGAADTSIDDLAAKYGGKKVSDKYSADFAADKEGMKSAYSNFGTAAKQGANDVLNSIGGAIGFVDKNVSKVFGGEGEKRAANFQERVKKENEDYKAKGLEDNTDATIGRFGIQTLLTAPLIPAKAVQAINVGMRALPTTLATGEKVAAPFINRLGASVATGGLGGAVYGAATSASNEDSLASNIGTGLITGALAGPVVMAAGGAASKLVNLTKGGWENVQIEKLARDANLSSSAVKNIVERLKDAGLTPQTAQAELTRLGPQATLADLDRSLTTEASGLAAMGAKPTAILKNRMDVRAEGANNNATKLFENKFGPKPDMELEKQNIINDARKTTKSDYEAAHASTDNLDASGVVSSINKQLENAVGAKENVLKTAKGYLFKTVKDISPNAEEGATKTVLKNDVASLHEVRQGIDDIINKKGDVLPGNANRAINQVREQVDELLKTNDAMKSADEKFAEKMKVKDSLQAGYDTIAKGTNKEEFGRAFDAASPEAKEKIKKGMLAATHDIMEKSAQGELTGAQRIFDKKSVNRSNFKKAFGADADEILDQLHQQLAFRNTERAITQGSQTAERQAVQARYSGAPSSAPGLIREALKGLAIDASTGSLGAATAVNVAKTGGRNTLLNISSGRLNRLTEGSADLLSRSGAERDNAMSVLQRVTNVQNKSLLYKGKTNIKLPVALSGPLGEKEYNDISGNK